MRGAELLHTHPAGTRLRHSSPFASRLFQRATACVFPARPRLHRASYHPGSISSQRGSCCQIGQNLPCISSMHTSILLRIQPQG